MNNDNLFFLRSCVDYINELESFRDDLSTKSVKNLDNDLAELRDKISSHLALLPEEDLAEAKATFGPAVWAKLTNNKNN